tara:strand:- start:2489 stop:3205 length:717 start_codon:yes stop_codon:yes gene_type:complete
MDDYCAKLTQLEALKLKTGRAAPLRRLLLQTVAKKGGVFQVTEDGRCIAHHPAEVKESAPLNEVVAMESLVGITDFSNMTCDDVMDLLTASAARGGGGCVKDCAPDPLAREDAAVTGLLKCIEEQTEREAVLVQERKRLSRELSKMRKEVAAQVGDGMRIVDTAASYVVLFMTGGDYGAPTPEGIRNVLRTAVEDALPGDRTSVDVISGIQASFFSLRNSVPCKERPLKMKSIVLLKH